EVVNPHTDYLIGVERQGPDITIHTMILSLQQVYERPRKVIMRIWQLHVEELSRLQETFEMIRRPENKKLILLVVPITAQTTEHRRPIIQGVGQNAHLRLRIGNNATFEESVFRFHAS